jgi:multidrug efflux pump subunit AcrA (membrane-fusion protein)
MFKKAHNCSTLFLILFIAGFLIRCNNQKENSEKEIEAKTPVKVTGPVFKSISETVEFSAVTAYIVKNIIRSSVTGIIESIAVTPGDNVKKGKLLFTLKTREASALPDSQSGDPALGFRGIINVISPKDGVITTVSHQSGDFVQEGDELAIMSDRKSLVFILEVPFEMAGYVEKARTCSLKLPDKTVSTGRIMGKLPEMNVQNQTIGFIVNPETNQQLPNNLLAVASVVKNARTGAQVLPRAAVLGNETQTEFWVMKLINDTTAIRIPVKKGIENIEEVEIVDPVLIPADKILYSGNYGLPDTASVIVTR